MAPICCSCRHPGLCLERSCLSERGLCVGALPRTNPSRLTKTVTVEPKRRCNVIWTVLGWIRNCDRRTDLWRALDARTDALDCGWRSRAVGGRNLIWCQSHTSERSCEIVAGCSRSAIGRAIVTSFHHHD